MSFTEPMLQEGAGSNNLTGIFNDLETYCLHPNTANKSNSVFVIDCSSVSFQCFTVCQLYFHVPITNLDLTALLLCDIVTMELAICTEKC